MNFLLAIRNVAYRPLRSALLLAGYGIGVAVMIVLLSIGEALVLQASDERLVGGGDVTVLPAGIDVEVMKTGGLGGMFFSIDNARFINLQVLGNPRLAGMVAAVAPQIDDELLYLRHNGVEYPVRADAEVPSASVAVGAGAPIAAGAWGDDQGDSIWVNPSPAQLLHSIDHFHLPPEGVENRESWGEWHYFNVLSADGRSWAFISLIVGGDVPQGEWGGQVLVTTHELGARGSSDATIVRRFASNFASSDVEFSTTRADLRIGESSVRVLPDGSYAVTARAVEVNGAGVISVNLVVTPTRGAYFPGASIGGSGLVSGYAVPALRAAASGEICIASACSEYSGSQAYHDHNWGIWRGVTWEWGASRAGSFTFLYGRVESEGASNSEAPLFFYLVDSLGYRALFRPREITYDDFTQVVRGRDTILVPGTAELVDVRGGDTLRVELLIEDASITDMRSSLVQRGEVLTARELTRPFFLQMKGIATLSGSVGGAPIGGVGSGFFETYVAPVPGRSIPK